MSYPKRLIEVDLPIKRISAHARREKSIRHGHISALHIWWARRPLAACRAVLCASLWPDPADELCPDLFRKKARQSMQQWADKYLNLLGAESYSRFIAYQKDPDKLTNNEELRKALLDFIADFANWDNSTVKEYLEASCQLTQIAHEALGGQPRTKPLVFDPFAGGGSIPLEALRVGADAFASDLNPIAVLLNKVILEYVPKYGQRLADEIHKWGNWVKKKAIKELAAFYPKDTDRSTPVAYLWARTIKCEGPNCGTEVPLIRSLWLAKKTGKSVALQLVPNAKTRCITFKIIKKGKFGWTEQMNPDVKIKHPQFEGTVKRGSAICPVCGYTTPVDSVRRQLTQKKGGVANARLLAVVTQGHDKPGKHYRGGTDVDLDGFNRASAELDKQKRTSVEGLSFVPEEQISLNEIRRISVPLYGMTSWGDLFNPRQALAIATLSRLVRQVPAGKDPELSMAVKVCLALVVDKQADRDCSMCRWISQNENIGYTFGRQALGMVWDFVEAPWIRPGGGWDGILNDFIETVEAQKVVNTAGATSISSASKHTLPDDSANCYFTDPPYYDAVPYAHLSDFFYVWLRRTLASTACPDFGGILTDKTDEIVVDRPHKLSNSKKDIAFYERELCRAFADGRRIARPDALGIIVFASKTTTSWEAVLNAVISAGWIINGSWPIDTEREARIAALEQARLASSVHLICRPRENPDGSVRTDDVGDWRDVLKELPDRMRYWMPRLAEEGVVGADAIFACLGPALEVFSRYSYVEKANGNKVELKEYLVHVWAAVEKEALNMIFEGADAAGFEEDSRLTAMWLWTLSTGTNAKKDDEKTVKSVGYTLEFDAARKIAQGLGAHLENLGRVVEIKGDKARLLPVAERTKYLFGKDESQAPVGRRTKKDSQMQLDFMKELQKVEREEGGWGEKSAPRAGETVLDQLHQAMILFAAGRGEAMKRFLVEEGIGRDGRFWRLAQALSALYPKNSDEKRWVDGVLARKKSLGF